MTRQSISTDRAPQPAGVYAQGTAWEQLLFTSGQVAIDPSTGLPVTGRLREQARQVLQNVMAIIEAGGGDVSTVLKTTCFLADINDFAAFNEVYREFFPADPPARSTVQAGLVSPWRVEIEAVAIRKGPQPDPAM